MARQSKNQPLSENPSNAGAAAPGGRIHDDESVRFCARIQEVIGDEPVASFGRRAGISESTLRTIINGAWPRTDNLVAIASTGGVEVGWLATGKGIKYSRDLRAQLEQEAKAPKPQPGRAQAESAPEAPFLPRRERFLDCTGREREFELYQGPQTDGVLVMAREVDPPAFPGYAFAAWSSNRGDALGRLRARIRAGLSRRYLVEQQGTGLQLLADEIVGEVWDEGLVVDGRMVDYDEIVRLLTIREGQTVTIQIKDGSE